MKVKVCGMMESRNLDKVLNERPDFVGFIFYHKSPRYVQNAEALTKKIKEVKKVGIFVNEDIEELIRKAHDHQLDYIQLHGDESPETCRQLKTSQLKVIKAFALHSDFDFTLLIPYLPFVDYFLFDTKGKNRGGNGEKFDWDILNKYTLELPFFLSGGITEEDVSQLRELTHPKLYAIDINSGFELSAGVKDIPSVARFIKKIKHNQ